MAMRTASPWWLSGIFVAALVPLFLGERAFDHLDDLSTAAWVISLLLMAVAVGMRVVSMAATRDDRRAVERMLLMTQVGVILSIVLYLSTTNWGLGLIGMDDLEGDARQRFVVPMTVIWTIVLACSLTPMLMIEFSLGTARRTEFKPKKMAEGESGGEVVEAFRVREMASAGLTIALAAAFLMVTCNIAKQRNIRSDVSYFKTSSPGESTVNIVNSVSQPVKVYLFFPEINQVKNEIRGYFEALADATGNVTIEERDFILDAKLAKQFKVSKNGTLVVEYDEKTKNETFTWEPEKSRKGRARDELRELDRKVNAALLSVIREKRTAYLTVGHGELNDPDSDWVKSAILVNELKRRLKENNYKVRDLSVANGLGTEIPEDATMIMMLGPTNTLLDEELISIEQYLDRGGHLMVALDPRSDAGLGTLGQRLGLEYDNTRIVDTVSHLRRRPPRDSDRGFITTNQVSAHGAITTLSRASSRYRAAFLGAGSFREIEIDAEAKARMKRVSVVRSMDTSFADKNGDYSFSEGEKRERYNIVMAVEEPSALPEGASGDHEGMRAILFGDIELFADPFQQRMPTAIVILDDVIRWLGGEEALAGEIVAEKDVVIEHTRNQDEVWFYATIVGAPLFVLGFGFWFGWWRRTRRERRAS